MTLDLGFPPFPTSNNVFIMAQQEKDKDDWDYSKDDDLMDLAEANRCLFDTSMKEYSNRDGKQHVKEQIARRLKCTGRWSMKSCIIAQSQFFLSVSLSSFLFLFASSW